MINKTCIIWLILSVFVFKCDCWAIAKTGEKNALSHNSTEQVVNNVATLVDTTTFDSSGRGKLNFCFRVANEEALIEATLDDCFYQPIVKPEGWLAANGLCYQSDRVHILNNILSAVANVSIKNNRIIGGTRAVEFLLMNSEAPCNIIIFNENKNMPTLTGDIPSWLFALHLVYTSYGDENSWPMPNRELLEQFQGKYGKNVPIGEEHKEFLYTVWLQYITKYPQDLRRWLPFNRGTSEWAFHLRIKKI